MSTHRSAVITFTNTSDDVRDELKNPYLTPSRKVLLESILEKLATPANNMRFEVLQIRRGVLEKRVTTTTPHATLQSLDFTDRMNTFVYVCMQLSGHDQRIAVSADDIPEYRSHLGQPNTCNGQVFDPGKTGVSNYYGSHRVVWSPDKYGINFAIPQDLDMAAA